MSPVRFCDVCDMTIEQGEPTMIAAGRTIHRYCSLEGGNCCRDMACGYWMTDHSGPCLT